MVVTEAPGGKEAAEEFGSDAWVGGASDGVKVLRPSVGGVAAFDSGVGVGVSVGTVGVPQKGGLVIVLDAGEAGEEAPPMARGVR